MYYIYIIHAGYTMKYLASSTLRGFKTGACVLLCVATCCRMCLYVCVAVSVCVFVCVRMYGSAWLLPTLSCPFKPHLPL